MKTLLTLPFALAVLGQVQPPPPAAPRPFSFPRTESKALPNGLTVIVAPDPRQPLVSYRLVIPSAGSSSHDPRKAGLADLTAQLLRNGGTKTRTSQEIAKIVDAAGGSLSASASDDSAALAGTWLKSSSDLGLQLLADTLLNPVFAQGELDRIRQQVLSGMQVRYGNPEFLATAAASRLLFGEHPYAFPTSGTRDTIRALKRDDLVAFHRSHYVPQGAYLAIAGDITPADAFARVTKHLGEWKGSAPAVSKSPDPPAPARQIVVIDKPDAVQTQIIVAELGVPRNHPDYIPLALANHIYGGSHTSRLSQTMRSNEGLTYSARSNVNSQRVAGLLTTSTFTRTEKTAEAIGTVVNIQNDFAAKPPTTKELEDAKAFQSGIFALAIETADSVANFLLMAALNGLPADYWQTFPDRIRATTLDQVTAAAKKHFHPDKTTIVAAGNAAQFAAALAPLGKVRVVKATEFDEMSFDLVKQKEAAPAATGASRAKGKALVDAAVQAVGGIEALRAVKDISSNGSLEMKTPKMTAEMREELLYPDQYKSTMKLPFGEIIQGYDGKVLWMKQGPQPVREMPAQAASGMAASILAAGGIGVLREPAEVHALDDSSVLWKRGDLTMKIWFDPQSHRISKLSYTSLGPAGAAELEMTMEDYRPVGGVMLPFKSALSQNGQALGDRIFTERKVNTGIAASVFAKPGN
jgi:zinc protease